MPTMYKEDTIHAWSVDEDHKSMKTEQVGMAFCSSKKKEE